MFEDKIKRGYAFLLAENMNINNLNLQALDMSRPTACVLGQLYGNYWDALDVLSQDEEWAVEYAFLAENDWHSGTLTNEWRSFIKNLDQSKSLRERLVGERTQLIKLHAQRQQELADLSKSISDLDAAISVLKRPGLA